MLDDKSDIRINEVFRQFRLACKEDKGAAQIGGISLQATEDGDGNKSIQLAIVAHIKAPDESSALADQFAAVAPALEPDSIDDYANGYEDGYRDAAKSTV